MVDTLKAQGVELMVSFYPYQVREWHARRMEESVASVCQTFFDVQSLSDPGKLALL